MSGTNALRTKIHKTRTSPWLTLPCDPKDPRQLTMFPDDHADRREILTQIDALVHELGETDRRRIVALNAQLKLFYHPNEPRSACSTAMLRSILAGLEAEKQSVAVT